jgi:probable F420-dependent oxidoreductase
MHLGLFTFPSDSSIDVPTLARLAEDSGFESLWIPDHTHIPASRDTPFPLGGELGYEYSHNLDQVVALAVAAAVTTKLKLAAGLCLLAQRDPIIAAKQYATLDHVSGGRLIFGVGGGWNREEAANHTDADRRFAVLEEHVAAVREIWTNDEASYRGRDVDFDRIWSWPKPVRKPHPPILLGGNGPRVIERAARWADGWVPLPLPSVAERLPELRERAAANGREVSVTIFGVGVDCGAAELERWAELGVERCVFHLASSPRAEIERQIEQAIASRDALGALA